MRLISSLLMLMLLAAPAEARLRDKWHPSLPSPLRLIEGPEPTPLAAATLAKGYVLGLPWCFFTGVAIYSIVVKRELKRSEAFTVLGSCIVPVVGGIIMKKLFDAHPEWDELPGEVTPVDFGISSQH